GWPSRLPLFIVVQIPEFAQAFARRRIDVVEHLRRLTQPASTDLCQDSPQRGQVAGIVRLPTEQIQLLCRVLPQVVEGFPLPSSPLIVGTLQLETAMLDGASDIGS